MTERELESSTTNEATPAVTPRVAVSVAMEATRGVSVAMEATTRGMEEDEEEEEEEELMRDQEPEANVPVIEIASDSEGRKLLHYCNYCKACRLENGPRLS